MNQLTDEQINELRRCVVSHSGVFGSMDWCYIFARAVIKAEHKRLIGVGMEPVHEVWISTDSCNEHYGYEDVNNLDERQWKKAEKASHRYIYTAEQLAAARLQDQQLISKLEEQNNIFGGIASAAQKRIKELEKELDEQCRLHGMGSEREARQLARIAELEANLNRANVALKDQQIEVNCECKNCMNAHFAIESSHGIKELL